MCSPAFIPIVAGVVQAYGQVQQGRAAKNAANYNAGMMRAQARDAVERGDMEAEVQSAKVKQVMGRQRAAMGASGADVDTGSFGDVLEDTAGAGALDTEQIRHNAWRSAWGLETQADLTKAQGQAAYDAGAWGAAGTLLTSAVDAYGMGQKYGWKSWMPSKPAGK